jgi:lysophospholipid acyltransferase
MVLMVLLEKKIYPTYCGSDEFLEKTIIYRYFYMMGAIFVMRCKYYTGWKITQASVMFSGLGYDQLKDPNTGQKIDRFDKIESCNIWNIEFHHNVKTRIQYWNRTVHLWLKYYVFLRLINVNKKPFKGNTGLASLITFMISAFWHGFYPIYYWHFFEFYLIDQIGSILDTKYDFFNWIAKQSIIIQIIYWNFVSSILQYVGLTFAMLDLKVAYNFHRAFYFIPSLILIVLFFTLIKLNKKKKHKDIKES